MPEEKKQKETSHKELKKKFEECKKLRDEYLTGWQRSRADFLNYQKEESQRFKQFFEIERARLILEILPILDNFQKAKKELSQSKELSSYLEGLNQIEKQFQKFLEEEEIEEIKCLGEKFNPNFHQAVEEIEVKGKESGEILEVVQKGYQLASRVIRPAKVKVIK